MKLPGDSFTLVKTTWKWWGTTSSVSNDPCLQRAPSDSRHIIQTQRQSNYKRPPLKDCRHLIHRKMDAGRHKGVDCRIPPTGESESFPSPPFILDALLKSVHDDKGICGFNVLSPPRPTALSACLFNQNPFKPKGLIEAVKKKNCFNCLTEFETRLNAQWNISSPPVNQRLFIMRAFSCPPLPVGPLCWITHIVLFVRVSLH